MSQETVKRAVGLQPALIYYFQQNANRRVTVQELVDNLEQFDDRQLMQGMWHLLKKETLPGLQQVGNRIWQFTPGTVEGKVLITFEVLKGTDTGWLVTDDEQNVYRVELLG